MDVNLKFIITFFKVNQIQKHQWSEQISEHGRRTKIVLSDILFLDNEVHVIPFLFPDLDVK
jgi:hypothetical protein